MNKQLLWIVFIIIAILIALGIIYCPPGTSHNHFVSSGNIDFLGSSIETFNYSQYGEGFITTPGCINKATSDDPIHFHIDYNLNTSCTLPVTATLKTRFFINSTEVTTVQITGQKGSPSSTLTNFTDPSSIVLGSSDFDISGANCSSKIHFDISVPLSEVTNGDKMFIVLEIDEEQNFQPPGNYDPILCPVISNCDNIPDNNFARYFCYENSACQERDKHIIFTLLPLCGGSLPNDDDLEL